MKHLTGQTKENETLKFMKKVVFILIAVVAIAGLIFEHFVH